MSPASFRLGDFDCHVLYDGSRSIGSMTEGSAMRFVFGDAPEAEVEAALGPYGGISPDTRIHFNYLLAENEGHLTLLDVGCGDQAENDENPDEPAGLLVKSLGEAGFSVDDVDTVVVSHGHWDHFGGAVTAGKATFPNAEYVMSAKEAEYINAKAEGWAREYLRVLGDKLRLLPDVAEVAPGVTVKVAPGHTPGIAVTELSSRGETLLYTSDIILHPIHVEHTDWIPSFETDKVAAAAGRRRLIEDAHRRRLLLFVPHIPGVLGTVKRAGTGYMWADDHRSA
ncbi:TPA: MBL fold metallo-hydrolase [Candidatus Bathyarchaeota archaeon]|nr:MBL fold metallo-hydrolase [Candidatus Bathyarchaeota archaeon]